MDEDAQQAPVVQSISGTITMANGDLVTFAIYADGESQQWGAPMGTLMKSRAVLDAMVTGLFDDEIWFVGEERDRG